MSAGLLRILSPAHAQRGARLSSGTLKLPARGSLLSISGECAHYIPGHRQTDGQREAHNLADPNGGISFSVQESGDEEHGTDIRVGQDAGHKNHVSKLTLDPVSSRIHGLTDTARRQGGKCGKGGLLEKMKNDVSEISVAPGRKWSAIKVQQQFSPWPCANGRDMYQEPDLGFGTHQLEDACYMTETDDSNPTPRSAYAALTAAAGAPNHRARPATAPAPRIINTMTSHWVEDKAGASPRARLLGQRPKWVRPAHALAGSNARAADGNRNGRDMMKSGGNNGLGLHLQVANTSAHVLSSLSLSDWPVTLNQTLAPIPSMSEAESEDVPGLPLPPVGLSEDVTGEHSEAPQHLIIQEITQHPPPRYTSNLKSLLPAYKVPYDTVVEQGRRPAAEARGRGHDAGSDGAHILKSLLYSGFV